MRDYDKEPIAAVEALRNTSAKTDKRSAKQALIKQILLLLYIYERIGEYKHIVKSRLLNFLRRREWRLLRNIFLKRILRNMIL